MSNEITVMPISVNIAKDDDQKAEMFLSEVRSTVITKQEEAQTCADKRKEIHRMIETLESKRMSITKPLDTAKKAVMDLFRTPIEKLESAKSIYGKLLYAWDIKVKAEQEKQAELIRQQQEKEAKKLEAKADKLEAKGKVEEAENMKQEAEIKKNFVPVVEAPKTKGISFVEDWRIESCDVDMLPEMFNGVRLKIADEKQIEKLGKQTKGQIKIPGVVFKKIIIQR